eukprot:6471547-Amphidinium_carterae.1
MEADSCHSNASHPRRVVSSAANMLAHLLTLTTLPVKQHLTTGMLVVADACGNGERKVMACPSSCASSWGTLLVVDRFRRVKRLPGDLAVFDVSIPKPLGLQAHSRLPAIVQPFIENALDFQKLHQNAFKYMVCNIVLAEGLPSNREG